MVVKKNSKKEIRVTVGGKKRTGRNKLEEHLVVIKGQDGINQGHS